MENAIVNYSPEAMAAMQKDFIGDLTSREAVFCSMEPKTDEDRKKLFNAMNNPEKRLADEVNMTIKAKDLFCEVVTVNRVDENTDEVRQEKFPRVVIIDDKGVGHQCVSIGVYSALRKIISMFGTPTWEKPLEIKVKQINKNDRRMLTLEM